jgi:zinc protease
LAASAADRVDGRGFVDDAARRLRNWLLGAAALGAAGAAPAAAQVFHPETFSLANGLQVVVVANHRAPIVSQMVWYRIGAADEVQGKSGIAHFLEHLMFKGTPNIAPGEFSKIVARNGGRDNAFTGHDYTGYFQNVARDRLELVMKIEADRMANLVLTDAVVDPERDVILEERRQVVDNNPRSRLSEQMYAALYLNHPYGRPVIGWEHEMRGLTTADALAWYHAHYAPNNAVLIVAGDITAAELKPLAEKYYGAIAQKPIAPRLRPLEPPPQAARRVELKDERVRQPNWRRMYLAPSYNSGAREHAYPLQILAEIFGGGATSRLYRRLVVEREIATGAGAGYDADALDQGTFSLSASPRAEVEMAALEAGIEDELKRLLTDGVTAEEVDRAKGRMRASAVYARDSLQAGARAIGAALATGQTVEDVEQWPARIGAVTPEQVNAAARFVLREERAVTGLLLPKPSS